MTEVPFYDLRPAVWARRAALRKALEATLDGGYFVGGTAVAKFEQEFASYLRVQECVGVGNGLDALRIGMEALGIGSGDEVIVPGFTFYATWLAVIQSGAKPVPVDIDINTASISLSSITQALTKRTKAIVVVHLFGIPANLVALRDAANEAGVYLIEDAAQSHGANSGHFLTGSVGDFAAFSFYPTKNLGALGDGGAITTNSTSIAATARSRRSYGQGDNKYEHIDTGWNSRLDSLQAAFLSNDLPNLDSLNARRREIASVYIESLGPSSAAVVGGQNPSESVWHQFVLRTTVRDQACEFFGELGVHTDIHYPYFFNNVVPLKRFVSSWDLPISRLLSEQVVSLPISPWLTEREISAVAGALAALPQGLIACN